MRHRSVLYHGVRLRVAPQPYECPYCLHPIGLIGNLVFKLVGREAHGCPRTNVLTADEVAAEEASRGGARAGDG